MKVTVSGFYRFDIKGATEQGLKQYSIVVDVPKFHRGNILVEAARRLKKMDADFDFLKTHIISEVKNAAPTKQPAKSAEGPGPDFKPGDA